MWIMDLKTLVWKDLRLGDRRLKDCFPILYVVSFQKNSVMAEVGILWDDYFWGWNSLWRWFLLVWELHKFNELNKLLFKFSREVEDRFFWKFDSNSVFSVNSFMLAEANMSSILALSFNNTKVAWQGTSKGWVNYLCCVVCPFWKVNTKDA